VLSIATLSVVALADFATGKDVVFTFFYLVPIAIAIWCGDRKIGLALCLVSAAIRLSVEVLDHIPIGKAIWNAGVRLGVYLAFFELLSVVKTIQAGPLVVSMFRRHAPFSIVAIIALVLVGELSPVRSAGPRPNVSSASTIALVPMPNSDRDQSPLGELADLVKASMRASRPVLLGSRDPNGPSCVTVSSSGDVSGRMPDSPGDLNGGPGTTYATVYYFDRREIKSPLQDYQWHQTRLRQFLQNESASNQLASALADRLAERTLTFWNATNSWTEVPDNTVFVGGTGKDNWPEYCLTALNDAVGARDLEQTRRWAGELAAAALWLDDLHRWLGFLVENHLSALDFQRQCQTLFESAQGLNRDYDPEATISQFPAGVLSLNGKGNYYEVERQAERLFSMPSDRLEAIGTEKYLSDGSMWMSPVERESFMKLREALSADNQRTWDQAARQPYQHSYLVNMLFRADHVRTDDELLVTLEKFNKLHPHAQVGELMNALMYRGHSFAGLEWGDRFRPELIEAAEIIGAKATDLEAFKSAWRWTNDLYQADSNYGVTFTLRDALQRKRLDCVRATDMITSIYRNAGHVGAGNVRWCSETSGHSVAALMVRRNNDLQMFIGDGLMPPAEPEVWPECYFQGHAWPKGLEANSPPYAAELYVRGLDGYVWAEGYIIRGPNAGMYTSVDTPYSAFHHNASISKRIFAGPYPQ
jgi:hypothetical protein